MKRVGIFSALLVGLALAIGVAIVITRQVHGVEVGDQFAASASTIFGMTFMLAMVAIVTAGVVRLIRWFLSKSNAGPSTVPLISFALALVLAINPVGLAFLNDAFFASEQLTRNIAQPIVLIVIAGLVCLAGIETTFRRWHKWKTANRKL